MKQLVHGEERWHGARYHTIKPEGYTPNWDNQLWNEMVEWCVDQMGPAGSLWTMDEEIKPWYVNNAKFWFREKDDAVMFVLRWA
jgi:hypothetical protein